MPDVVKGDGATESALRAERIAPWQHTAFIVAVLGLWAMYGGLRWHLPLNLVPRSVTYASSVMIQWLLVGTVIAGLYHRRQFVREVFGPVPEWRAMDVVKGCAVFVTGLGVIAVIGLATRHLNVNHSNPVVKAMAPHSRPELALWMLVSATAGVCEEFVFRGYLLRQVARWCGNSAVAVGATAIMFGCMHFYEGSGAVIAIIGLGALFGTVAAQRGDLRTVAVAHFLQDAVTGAVLYLHR